MVCPFPFCCFSAGHVIALIFCIFCISEIKLSYLLLGKLDDIGPETSRLSFYSRTPSLRFKIQSYSSKNISTSSPTSRAAAGQQEGDLPHTLSAKI